MNTHDPFATLIQARSPFPALVSWFNAAPSDKQPPYPNAAQLATVDQTGMPNIRTVLIKELSDAGLVFFTNFESQKGEEILTSKRAALLFYWPSLGRQIRIRGAATPIAPDAADRYFATRPRGSQISAHVSRQSRTLPSREIFLKELEAATREFGDSPIPRPDHWSGFRVVPESVEFWQEGDARRHDRLLFEKINSDWQCRRLYP
jgi:pyridoxamine 5'-phosphate oxidase